MWRILRYLPGKTESGPAEQGLDVLNLFSSFIQSAGSSRDHSFSHCHMLWDSFDMLMSSPTFIRHLCCQQLFSLVCGDWYKVINYLPLAVIRETIWDKFKRNRQDWGCSDARQGSGWSSWQQPGGSQGCGEEEWWYIKRLSSGDTC